ncbi:IS3 family transposase [Mannheimia massilioguelmaensis]|uniref:IS3 family transposase n=1 Tax=Mannheimia massilioguelmaensis TaxID=1604354 RepID=UPI0009E38B25
MLQKVVAIYPKNQGNYGYRCITLMLRKSEIINQKKVKRIMQQLDLKGKCKRRRYRSYQGEVGKIVDNRLQRDFHSTVTNQK